MGIAPVRTTVRLRVRLGAPSTAVPAAGLIESGSTITPIALVAGEAVAGNANWYQLDTDRFVWAGWAEPPSTSVPATPVTVSYRTDVPGAIAVLSDAERATLFGSITQADYTTGAKRGAINLSPAWQQTHLVTIPTPPFVPFGPTMTVHKLAVNAFNAVFAKIQAAGLDRVILHCDGTFVARHKGWDPARSLSSHTWGIAIDLNARWNAYGSPPAPLGAIGSVRELVDIFASEGFAWGGYFTPDQWRDGMHFELARRAPLP